MTKKQLITGLALGAAIGGAIGYLYATESGAKTRKKIADKSNDLFGQFMDYCMAVIQGATETANDIKDSEMESADEIKNKSL